MAAGAYLSTKSDQEYYDRERERERWEVDHYPEGEKAELLELYRHQGYLDDDAAHMVAVLTHNLLDLLTLAELMTRLPAPP